MTQQAPAGWYPVPGAEGQLRWWDGVAWTNHTRDAADVPQPVVPRHLGEVRQRFPQRATLSRGSPPTAADDPRAAIAMAEGHIAAIQAMKDEREAAAKEYVAAVERARAELMEARRGRRLAWFPTVTLYETEIVVNGVSHPLGPDVRARVEETGTLTKTQGWVSKETVDTQAKYLYLDGNDWAEVISVGSSNSQYQWGTKARGQGAGIRRFEQEVNQAARTAGAARARLRPLVAAAERALAEIEPAVPSALAKADAELARLASVAVTELAAIRTGSAKAQRVISRATDLARSTGESSGNAVATVAAADALKAVRASLGWLERSGNQHAIQHLAAAMTVGERVAHVVAARSDKRAVLVAVTDRRLVVASPTGIRAWALGQGVTVDSRNRALGTEVMWRIGAEVVTISLPLSKAKEVMEAFRLGSLPAALERGTADEPEDRDDDVVDAEVLDERGTESGAGGDAMGMLERLAALHRAGALSDDEFAAKKAELLKRL